MEWDVGLILYLVIFSGSPNHGIKANPQRQHLDDDFNEMEWLLERNEAHLYNIRLERSPDYGGGLGGPLAAASGPGQPTPAPITAPRTAAPGPAPITAPSDKGRPAPTASTVDQCRTANSLTGVSTDRQTGKITNTRRDKGPIIKTDVVVKEKTVLKAIRDGEDTPNDYLSLKTVNCPDDDKCREACNREGCNYFLSYYDREKSPLTFLYSINEDILTKESNYVQSGGFNSYVITYHKNTTHATTSTTTTTRVADKASQQARPRTKRVSIPCIPCIPPAFELSALQIAYCDATCGGTGLGGGALGGGLLALILALALGLGIGIGVGVGVGAGSAVAAGVAAAKKAAADKAAQAASSLREFQQWQETYSKTYESSQLQQQAEQNFEQNQQNMAEANKRRNKSDDATQGNTKFSDLPFGAFAGYYTGAMTDGPIQPIPFNPPLDEIIPRWDELPKLNWEGAASSSLPPIRYQGKCGACYAFTTADLVASQNAIERRRVLKDVQTQPLSVQYMIDCGGTNASVGCKGGRPGLLMKNLQNSDGVPFESCYPYREEAGTSCEMLKAQKCCEKHKVKFSQLIDISGIHEKELFANILNWGPVIAIVGANEQWMFYNGTGIIKARQCDPKLHNHAVIIAGYNYNQSTTPTPYYVVRNSWGTDWGTNGYAKLEAGHNACGVAKYILVTCTGDCRNVTSVKDLINRSNVPDKYQEEHATKVNVRNSTSKSSSLSSSSRSSSSSSSFSSQSQQSSSSSSNQQKSILRGRK